MVRQRAHERDFSAHLEQLEPRQLMTASPLVSLFGSSSSSSISPQLEQTVLAGLDPPPLTIPALDQHVESQVPPLDQHVESEIPPLDQHLASDVPPLDQHVTPEWDFHADAAYEGVLDDYYNQLEQQLVEAHQQTGWNTVQSNYGFTGRGQTIAVIDTGIAYNHFALGGGLGSAYRVVGGWDFAENDADPYDDGPSGGHGTHVSGIAGNSSSPNTGVAPGVDFVGLRVFNDAGQGTYGWVESALQWVHAHRNDFENPITAINLSLGTSSWNGTTPPSWAMLEDEFAQLKADGIFIAVSAGNSFVEGTPGASQYNTPGLSYPASSPYVVPVMSTDDSGLLSYFSQRQARAIAAPGRSITSTIPDYKGNNNGIADDFGGMSGTSMASPYVAGSSVLIRQAMQFVGMTGINEDTIYNHMMATADTFTDAYTGLQFKRLNLWNAINALMPSDDYGSTLGTAQNMGSLTTNQTYNGAIAKLNDVDMFKFTASTTGSVTFAVSNAREDMTATWTVYNSGGGVVATGSNSSISFTATSGQVYTVSLGSSTGLGHYTLTASNGGGGGGNFTYTDWGSVLFNQVNNVVANGQAWYRVQAGQNGYLTAQGAFNAGGGNVTVDIYDANQALLASGTTASGLAKATATATAGTYYYVRVSGVNSDVDFTLCNLVAKSGTTVTVTGTSSDDTLSFVAGTNHAVTVNGVSYSFAANQVSAVNFVGGAGIDTVTLSGTTAVDTATLRFGSATLASSTYSASATGVENVVVLSGGGADQAFLYDSSGDDVYQAYTNHAGFAGSSGSLWAWNFAKTTAYASTGNDVAHMFDSTGDDLFDAYWNRADMTGSGYSNSAIGFDVALGYASTGYDRAYSHDTTGDDIYSTYKDRAVMYNANYATHAISFDMTVGYATGGTDMAFFYDSAGDDTFDAYADRATMSGTGFANTAMNFEVAYAFASAGYDRSYMHDSAGDDLYDTYQTRSSMWGTGYSNNAVSFDWTIGYASTGTDRAYYHGSSGDDTFRATPTRGQMTGAGYDNSAEGFDGNYAFGSDGVDTANFYDSTGNDTLLAWSDKAVLYGTGYFSYAETFERVNTYASSGNDSAYLYDTAGDDLYRAWNNRSVMSGANYYNYAQDFKNTFSISSTGNDTAYLYDSAGNDIFQAWSDRAIMSGTGYFNYVEHYANVYGVASTGTDAAYFYDSAGNDSYWAQGAVARLSGSGYRNESQNFDTTSAALTTGADSVSVLDTAGADLLTLRNWGLAVSGNGYRNEVRGCKSFTANSTSGGADSKDLATVDYLYSLLGAWA